MQIFRSIAAVVIGAIVGVIVIWAVESINFIVYGPSPEKPFTERMQEMQKMMEDKQAMKAWIEGIPINALAMLQVAWSLGAFLGGGVAALIAGRARLTHAGIIGALIVAATVINVFQMKEKLDYDHPDWLVITGVLLPIPCALLAGFFVAMLFPTPPPAPVPPT